MNETTDATAIFAPLWKRKWLILAVGILVAGATYGYYKRKPPVYLATTQVYLGSGSEEQGVFNNVQGRTTLSERDINNQAALINSNVVGEAVHRRLREEHYAVAAHGKAHAKSAAGSDFITISAEASTARGAALLANGYAQAYIKRQHTNYQREVKTAIASTRQQLRRIESSSSTPRGKGSGRSSSAAGGTSAVQAASLVSRINQLEADLAVAGIQQISPAKASTAQLLSPKPKQNAIFGFVLGVLLAAIAAYTSSRFDRRLRSLADIEAVFQTQLLTALPIVRGSLVRRDGQPAPAASLLEPLRRLHTTLQLGDMLEPDRKGSLRSILFLSADAGDGKSTLIANLALVQRDANEQVAVIEADLRRPVQARLLGVDRPNGLADVLAGTLTVDEGMQRVGALHTQASTNSAKSTASVATVVESRNTGSVSVLVGGGAVANPPALLADPAMADLLRSVADNFDHVLIDAPSPLAVSDAMPLLAAVDGIVIVARVGHTREGSAQRLVQLLAHASSAPVLGIVANAVSHAEIEGYGFSQAHNEQRRRHKLIGR